MDPRQNKAPWHSCETLAQHILHSYRQTTGRDLPLPPTALPSPAQSPAQPAPSSTTPLQPTPNNSQPEPHTLQPKPTSLADALYHAPFILLAHNADADPHFTFGNARALTLWEYTWEELLKTPSRLSAEPGERTERERLLHNVQTHGYCDNYRGIRISKTGRRFWIEAATVWNLRDTTGTYTGQAALFHHYHYL